MSKTPGIGAVIVTPMATVRTEAVIDAPAELVWDAVRDWGALHERLVPGFVIDTRLDGTDRIVTFGSGLVVRELLIDLDDSGRRLVWSVVDGPYTHHNGVAQVFETEDGRTRFVWTADFLPHTVKPDLQPAMELGTQVVKRTLETAAARTITSE
jgi:Polyketide cyclase / dehydrase and lipid transport